MDRTSAMPKLAPFALLHGRPDHGEFAWFCMAGTSSLAPRLLARPVPVYSTARAAQELASLLHAAPPPRTPGDARPTASSCTGAAVPTGSDDDSFFRSPAKGAFRGGGLMAVLLFSPSLLLVAGHTDVHTAGAPGYFLRPALRTCSGH